MQAILPLIIFRTWLFFTDPVGDRPGSPNGYFDFISSWSSVFLPVYLPHGSIIGKYFDWSKISWEGVSYVGFATDFAILLAGISILVFLSRRIFKKIPFPVFHPAIKISIIGAFAVLLFSMRCCMSRSLRY